MSSDLTEAEQERADAYTALMVERGRRYKARTDALDRMLKDPTPENQAAFEKLGGQQAFIDTRQADSDFADQLLQTAVGFHAKQSSMDEGEFLSVAMYAGRVYGPRLLYVLDRLDAIRPDAYTAIVGSVWSLAEFPGQSLSNTDWLKLWAKAGFTIDDEPADKPTEPIRLWRGAPPKHKRGMSWTDNLDRARWFAEHRVDRGNKVWTAVVEPRRLLARIHESGRREDEWVINTRALVIREEGDET